jgi:hypothetical protein
MLPVATAPADTIPTTAMQSQEHTSAGCAGQLKSAGNIPAPPCRCKIFPAQFPVQSHPRRLGPQNLPPPNFFYAPPAPFHSSLHVPLPPPQLMRIHVHSSSLKPPSALPAPVPSGTKGNSPPFPTVGSCPNTRISPARDDRDTQDDILESNLLLESNSPRSCTVPQMPLSPGPGLRSLMRLGALRPFAAAPHLAPRSTSVTFSLQPHRACSPWGVFAASAPRRSTTPFRLGRRSH